MVKALLKPSSSNFAALASPFKDSNDMSYSDKKYLEIPCNKLVKRSRGDSHDFGENVENLGEDWCHSEASTMCTSDKLKLSAQPYAPAKMELGNLTSVSNTAFIVNSPPFEK